MDGTAQQATPRRFEFIGGQVCLDFVNTVGGIRGGQVHELLTSYADLVAWSLQAHLLTREEAPLLLQTAQSAAEEAAAVLVRAYTLREALYRIFTALIQGIASATAALDALNRELEHGMAGARLITTIEGFGWAWNTKARALDQVLGPIARAGAMLLTSEERKNVRQCASPSCGWMFLDSTKNHRRRWCSTTGCGNKARVQRHRQQRSMEKEKVFERAGLGVASVGSS